MDFFLHQEQARKQTGLLVFYFILAVVFIILAIYLVVTFLIVYAQSKNSSSLPSEQMDFTMFWDPSLFLMVSITTLLIVLLGSLYKSAQLATGGKAVAEMLGGRLISLSTKDLNERKILNVVEEMSIASGTPIPPVYLLENESGINAFAAGFKPNDAVIGVTKGCIEQLSRNELQGVIAHEFSHILNGDMRLNIRLTGVLHGILIIAMIGYMMFRSLMFSRSSSDKKGGGAAVIAIFGIAVMAIGYIGVFFGKLIKSAVSRQREFLADASAVQFTRDPSGISGALKKIGGFSIGSRLITPAAEQASHFFFSNGLSHVFFDLMATHPPLKERIKRLDPSFQDLNVKTYRQNSLNTVQNSSFIGNESDAPIHLRQENIILGVGKPSQKHVDYVEKTISNIPKKLIEFTKDKDKAHLVVYALLLGKNQTIRQKQLEIVKNYNERTDSVNECHALIDLLPGSAKLPLAEIGIRSLKEMTNTKYEQFRKVIDSLIHADNHVDLFEYAMNRMVLRRLDPVFRKQKQSIEKYHSIHSVLPYVETLISYLSRSGTKDTDKMEKAFQDGMLRVTSMKTSLSKSIDSDDVSILDSCLTHLSQSVPFIRKKVLEACVYCVMSDNRVTVEEGEMLRAVSDALDCPMPPFFNPT